MAAMSCGGGSDTTGPPLADAAVGVYTLATINSQQLPVIVQSGNEQVEITGGVVTLKEDRTFSDVTQLRITTGGAVTSETDAASGSWTRQANTVQFSPTGFAAYSMTWDGGNRLTQLIGNFTLIYAK
jgi:hypothetical protein